MNYEDQPDLLPPEDVVAPAALSRLREAVAVAGLTEQVLQSDVPIPVCPAAAEAIRLRLLQDTAPDRGATSEAAALEEDAMLCGYRLGRLILGVRDDGHRDTPDDLISRVDSMYLYALPLTDAAPIAELIERHVSQRTGAYEEAADWAWAFGLGLAAVETDQTTDR